MNFDLFRKNVKWAGLMVLTHIGAMIVFAIFVSSGLARLEENDLIQAAHANALLTDIIIWIIFSIFYFKISSSFTDYRRAVKGSISENKFSIISCYKKNFLREDIWKITIFAAFQLPFMAFFAVAGISYLNSLIVDRFYILEAGFYGTSGSAVAGWISCTITYAVIFLIFRLLFLALTARSIKKF